MESPRNVAYVYEDIERLDASKSVKVAGLRRIFQSGYVWDLRVSADGAVEGIVESDHKMRSAYLVRARLGNHELLGYSCTCTVKRTMICKHVVGLLCGAIVVLNKITDHPRWLTRYPNYKNWPETLLADLPVQNFGHVLGRLSSPLPKTMKLEREKLKKTGNVRKCTVDPVELNRKRPRDVRAETSPGSKRSRKAPSKLDI